MTSCSEPGREDTAGAETEKKKKKKKDGRPGHLDLVKDSSPKKKGERIEIQEVQIREKGGPWEKKVKDNHWIRRFDLMWGRECTVKRAGDGRKTDT